ncbi:MAG TPA: NAD(P)/FAD-dependent oxidoreductase [Acidimicrobiales bacterium]|nr:NAD(P)/FAD-dependent oxidoreductase [Acidimicrobiales bacterium]
MRVDVAIVGSGFGGVAAAIKLRERGITDLVVLERADTLGGTWRDNRYPGCRCDVPSTLYSFSFAPNPAWSNTFSYRPEIQAYLEGVARRHGVTGLIRYDTPVGDVRFDQGLGRWRLATPTGDVEARCVVLAIGGLSEPRWPDVDGLATFAGVRLHTAAWDESVDLAGKRVAVIGTGSSAIQAVPEIAKDAAALTVLQRTAPWVLPHGGHPIGARARRLFGALPLAERLNRLYQYARLERLVLGFVKDPQRMALGEKWGRALLDAQVPDPELRAKMTPTFRMGCKRVLLSNDWYPTFARPNVELVTDPIAAIEPAGVRLATGRLVECDALVCATGFRVTDNPMFDAVTGTRGSTVGDAFRGDLDCYRGTSFPGFPNLFMISGPNSELGHSSVLYMTESQLRYIVPAVAAALRADALVEPTDAAARSWTTDVRSRLEGTVWMTGCSSWYLNDRGLNTTIWPGFTFAFRRAVRGFSPGDHAVARAPS